VIRGLPLGRNAAPEGTLPRAWVGIGSNIGDRLDYIRRALGSMARLPGAELVAVSSVYDTLPVGAIGQPRFLNAVAGLATEIEPVPLMRMLLAIEQECDRVRHGVWGPRTLDLDLILYDQVVMKTEELTLPHPRARERAFVLVPLAEVAPDLVIPGGTESVSELVAALGDVSGKVQCVGGPPTVE
jgi:2-amino-4-hydroxy-6-hydroxymethyldihydropteridine diphosphokinase